MKIDKATCGNWILNGWPAEQIKVSAHDREILRGLASQMKELAERPVEEEKRKLWTAHNDLEDTRPVLLEDLENGWNEVLPYDKTIKCEGDMAQEWEMWLRKELCWGEKIMDDKPIETIFYLPYRAVDSKWGIAEERIGSLEDGEAYTWKSPLADLDEDAFEGLDLSTIVKTPVITVDMEATMAAVNLAREVFDGLLTVQLRHKWWWSPDITLSYSNLRGLENMMCDFYDFPEKVHEMMRLFTDGYLSKFAFLEENGLLPDNSKNCYVGSGGLGFTNQLHATPGQVKLMDMWGFNEAQETSEVSPEMVAEFVIPYQIELASKFGLNCYGCCEGLDKRWEHVRKIPRLRRVSCSQWANMERMSELLGSDYILSYKASPTDLAVEHMDEDYIRTRLRHMLEYTKQHGNHVEIIMKDNHTLANTPQNAFRWVEIAREEIARLY